MNTTLLADQTASGAMHQENIHQVAGLIILLEMFHYLVCNYYLSDSKLQRVCFENDIEPVRRVTIMSCVSLFFRKSLERIEQENAATVFCLSFCQENIFHWSYLVGLNDRSKEHKESLPLLILLLLFSCFLSGSMVFLWSSLFLHSIVACGLAVPISPV